MEKLVVSSFVQKVVSPSLAALLPGLSRGLNDPAQEIRRTCSLIVDDMCEIVEDPAPLELL